VGLGCNGIIDVMITPLKADDKSNPVELLSGIAKTRTPRVMVSIIDCIEEASCLGKTILFDNKEQFAEAFPVREFTASLTKDIEQSLLKEESKTLIYSADELDYKIFIEVIVPALRVVIYGGNYDIPVLARISSELGWGVTVVTNKAKANKTLFTIAEVLDNIGDATPLIDRYTSVMLMSHDYKTDLNNLQHILTSPASYIGLLGPKKRSGKIFDELESRGIRLGEQDFERIHSPAGLDIGAITPEEIALSIAAEIRAHFAGRQGKPLRLRTGTIYGN
jgi:xanthine/CO dehydrogenase XdhC/CoxF family maturation factor